MGNFIDQLLCDHEYHEIGTHRSPGGDVPGYWVNYIIAYCPKCKKEKHISYGRYELNAKKRKIDKQYKEEKLMRILFITGEDYSFLNVENEIGLEKAVKLTEEAGGSLIFNEEFYAEASIIEFGEVDTKFIDFVKNNLMDYDDSKSTDFYIIEEEN